MKGQERWGPLQAIGVRSLAVRVGCRGPMSFQDRARHLPCFRMAASVHPCSAASEKVPLFRRSWKDIGPRQPTPETLAARSGRARMPWANELRRDRDASERLGPTNGFLIKAAAAQTLWRDRDARTGCSEWDASRLAPTNYFTVSAVAAEVLCPFRSVKIRDRFSTQPYRDVRNSGDAAESPAGDATRRGRGRS